MEYSVNVEMLYPELGFTDKIRKAADAGFSGIEFWRWDNKDLEAVKAVCCEKKVKITAFSATGDYSICDRENARNAVEWVRKSIEAAKFLGCSRLITFPNHFTSGGAADFRGKYTRADMVSCIVKNLCELKPELEEAGVILLLEPLNNMGADAGMSVTSTSEGAAIIRAVNSPNIRLLCDFYHMQMMHGDLTGNVMRNLDIVPYVHLADAPDRFEPGTGEINYGYIIRKMLDSGFDGTICFECFASTTSDECLKKLKEMTLRDFA